MIRIINRVLESIRPIDTSLEPLNEVYFGKDEELMELETALQKIKDDLSQDPEAKFIKDHRYHLDNYPIEQLESLYQKFMNLFLRHPELNKIKKIIMHKFGFASVTFTPYSDSWSKDPYNKFFSSMCTHTTRGTSKRFVSSMKQYMDPSGPILNPLIKSQFIDPKREELISKGKLTNDQIDTAINRYGAHVTKIMSNRGRKIQQLDRDEDAFIDDYGKINGSRSDIGDRALIISRDGIKFDRKQIKIALAVEINPFRLLTDRVAHLVAVLLHEIGHNFSQFVIPNLENQSIKYNPTVNNWTLLPGKRSDEIFADRFATMHGYGPVLATNGLGLGVKDQKELNSLIKDIGNPDKLDEHPLSINDVKAILNQLYTDLQDPDLPKSKKRVLERDIADCTRLLNQMRDDYPLASILAKAERRAVFDKKARRIANSAFKRIKINR